MDQKINRFPLFTRTVDADHKYERQPWDEIMWKTSCSVKVLIYEKIRQICCALCSRTQKVIEQNLWLSLLLRTRKRKLFALRFSSHNFRNVKSTHEENYSQMFIFIDGQQFSWSLEQAVADVTLTFGKMWERLDDASSYNRLKAKLIQKELIQVNSGISAVSI